MVSVPDTETWFRSHTIPWSWGDIDIYNSLGKDVGKLLKKPQSVSLLSDPRHSTSQLFSLTRSKFFYYEKTLNGKKYAFENGKCFSHLQTQKVLPLYNGYLLAVKGHNISHMHTGKKSHFQVDRYLP